jgi:hypothetical protein
MAGMRVGVLSAGIILLLALSSCTSSSSSSPATPLLGKIPGCSQIQTQRGSTNDDNTTAEGGCTLSDGTGLNLYLWPSGDSSDQEDFAYQTAYGTSNGCTVQTDNSTGLTLASGQVCIMGDTSAYPWFITLDIQLTAPGNVTGLAPPIESALNGKLVTYPPTSWCTSGYCPAPSSPPPASTSPSPSSSPSSSPSPNSSPTPSPPPPTPAPAPPTSSSATSASGAWCTATATVYNAEKDWNNVYVNSNQPYTEATASADGDSWSYETNGSGYAEIYLNGPPPGAQITVTVGGATCTTSD